MYVQPYSPVRASLTLLADLTGVGIAQTIMGIQDAGVIACAKHFIGNEQVSHPELRRTWS
jgi:beta-glucosidase-like glycosyl hydrolase